MNRIVTLVATTALCTSTMAQALIDRYLTDALTYTNIVTSTDQVSNPRDLDFKPNTNELWVMLRGGSGGGAMVIVEKAGLPGQTDEYRKDSHSGHFMIQASAMAFSPNSEFAAVSEVQNTSSPTSTFMGPALWNSDLDIFATVFQNNWVSGMPLGSHIQMLHQSPFAMGIAADSAKVYWVMDGHFGNIVRYDFVQDHGPGYDYHGAGKIWRYTDVLVTRVPNIPSHMVLDRENGWLYFIDGGAKQVKRMNVWSGSETGNLPAPDTSLEPLASYKRVEGATVETIATWTTQPCGMDYAQGRLIVSDHTNGDIRVYDVSGTPTQIGTIATGQTGIMGVKIGPDGRIWFVNNTGNKVVRIDPTPLQDDAAVVGIVAPVVSTYTQGFYSIEDAICGPSVTPIATIKNNGSNTLSSLTIEYGLDDDAPTSYSWSGTLAAGEMVDVTLPVLPSSSGAHALTVRTSQPNGNADPNPNNDRMDGSYRSIDPVQPIPFTEGFDATVFPPAGWQYVHFNPNNYMSRNATVGGFGFSTGCMKMDNYSGDMDITGQLDYLLMPRVDLTNASAGTQLEFALAHRQYNTSSTDRLMVQASTDCGGTWSTLYDKQGALLSTGTPTTGTFTPNAAQWRTEFVDLASVVGQPEVLFMFVNLSDFGNNIYVDDINIGTSVGIIENHGAFGVQVFPNPSNGQLQVTLPNENLGRIAVKVFALDGTLVHGENWGATIGGMRGLDVGRLAKGSYLLELASEHGRIARERIVIQ